MELDPESGRLIDARVDETVVEPNYGGESFQGSHGRSSSATGVIETVLEMMGRLVEQPAGMPTPLPQVQGAQVFPLPNTQVQGAQVPSPSGAKTQGAQGKALPHPGAQSCYESPPNAFLPSAPLRLLQHFCCTCISALSYLRQSRTLATPSLVRV